jgi:uncharacterized repeat protein (TIGR01451 family)
LVITGRGTAALTTKQDREDGMKAFASGGWMTALRVAGVAAIAAVALVIPASSFGVHDIGLFELDTTAPQYANTADDSGAGAPYDWASIFDSSGNQTLTSAAEPRLLTADFSADSTTPDTSYFASSNKDIDDVSSWQCGSVNNPTPKDEISNAYAALFRDATNHVILYVGGERDKNNGNSFMGFWIFKGAVGCSSPGSFSGQHTEGDVLILSNFTGGGTHPLVEVYEWTGGALSLMSSGGFCHSVGGNDEVCGEVNATPVQTPWVPHNAAANPLDTNELLEVGVDLTDVLTLATGTVPCFARFQAETRSSQETTATLKDYAAGRFNTCSTGTNSTPMSGGVSVSGSSVLPGTQVTDQAVITGTALVGTPPAPTGSVSFFLCGPQGTQVLALCPTGGTSVGSVNLSGLTNPATVTSPPVAPTAPGWYCFRSVYSGDANYPDGSFDSGLNECFQVMKATPTVTTDIHAGSGANDTAGASPITSAAIGSTVHDKATVSGSAGTPAGTVTFTVYSGNTVCSGTGASAGTITLAGGIAHPSSDATVPVGGLSYKAHYNGSTLYDEADGPCESLTATRLTPNVSTDIHNAAHQVVTAVEVGSTVHDFVTVTGSAATPGSTVTVDWFANNTCAGTAASTSGNVTLDASGHADATGFPQGPLAVGLYGFQAHYAGDATYLPADGVCEPLRVVDANISITPDGVNRIGDPHTFTAHVNVNDGSGFANASGALVTFSKDSGPGTLSGPSCTTNASGNCTIGLTSSTTGVTTVSAHTTLSVSGVSLTRDTDGTGGNSAPATKRWVDARISLSPDATNEVGSAHTFTVTLEEDTGDGSGFQPAAGEHVDFTLTDANGANDVIDAAASTCDDAGPNTNAGGNCTIVFTSGTAGTVTADASATLSVAGSAPITVETDGSGANGSDSVKTFVDANIQISPQLATNALSSNHKLTGHVNVNGGSGTFADAPDGTTIDFSIISGPGSFVGADSCTTSGGTGSCDVFITSATTGTTVVRASTDVSVGGVALHRETADGKAGDSDDATKKWAAVRISIAPDATNEVGDSHTFVVTLEKDPGTGTFVPAQDEHVDFTLSDSNGANSVLDAAASTCDDAGANTDSNGQCTITFMSNTAGKVTGHASATLTVGGATVTTETNGSGGSTGDAVKTFVDANIQITSDGVNHVGQTHTFTVHVNVHDGTSFGDASSALVSFSIESGPGALSNGNVSNTSCSTNANGNCTIDLTSSTTGVTLVKASTSLLVGGVTLTRSTNGTGANSEPASKKWVDARISIAPNATNEVGDPHTFVVTLEKDPGTGTFVPAQDEHVDFLLSDSDGANSVLDAGASTCDDAGANTDSNGQCTITFTSATPGKVTAHASSTLSVAGSANFTVETDGVAPNGDDAVKTFVDANIQITPETATNPLSTNHTLTGHVNVNDGSGGFVNAPAGTTIDFSLTNSAGASASFIGPNSCATVGVTGSCNVVISSSTAGTTTIKASTDVTVGGVSLHRETGDANAGDSGEATKKWATARISIAPNATNEVGDAHTFVVTLEKDPGTGTFVPAQDEHVDFTLSDSNGANSVLDAAASTCDDAGANTDQNGQCTITFTSGTAGKVTGHASASLTIGGATVTTETNGTGGSTGDAVKTFVDANIQITPATATNPVDTNHVLTGHVNVNDGSGGFVNAPEGTTIDFSIVSGPGTFVGSSSCTTIGASGSCTVTITSATTGSTKIRAATDVTVGGVSLHRETGDEKAGDSGDATKLWASAKISIAPTATNEVGQSHTFTVTLMKDTSEGTFVPAADEHVAVTLTDSNGANHSAPTGSCTNAGPNTDVNGQCTITFTSVSAGKVTGHATATLTISGASITVSTNGTSGNSADAVKTFVDANIQITPGTAINAVGTTHTLTGHVNVNSGSGGFANAPNGTTISFSLPSGPASFVGPSSCATAGGTGSCTVVISSSTAGTTTIRAATDVTVGGITLHRQSGDAKAGDSADAAKLWADDSVRTDILNATGGVVTTVVAGTVVHDKAFVTRTAGTPAGVPNPTGSVIFHRYATIDCTGTATNQTAALTPGSPSTAVSDDFAPTANMSYRAEYLGDANYPARNGDCEPLTVTPIPAPAIAIVKNPKGQTVAVGGTATFNITVTNAGNTVLTDVHVEDPLTPDCNRTKAQIPALASMDPGATVTYTCVLRNVRASFNNVATATGTPPLGPNVTATDTAPVKTKALTPPKKKTPKKKKKTPKVVSHKKPKTTG